MADTCQIDVELVLRLDAPGDVTVSVAVAGEPGHERLSVEGAPGAVRTVDLPHGTRLHVVEASPGDLKITYRAEHHYGDAAVGPVTDAERNEYLRPSRFCPSDRLGGYAQRLFGEHVDTAAKVQAVVEHVWGHLAYVGGASGPTDDAVDTLLSTEGVCRDYAHLCVALCRALDVPARFTSVYAPGLSPMDFHAVFEAAVDGTWRVFDATRLAPRQTLVRIATGRDAADTAFLTTPNAAELLSTQITVTAHPDLPNDDVDTLVSLA